MFENVLMQQNPHWTKKKYPAGIKRECFNKFIEYLETPLIISITGIRRSGKSTLMKQGINYLITKKKINPKNILFLNLEHPYFSKFSNDVTYLEKILEEYLKLKLPEENIYIFLDEVQFFKDWQIFVKAHFEQKKIKFIISGSNSYLLSSELMTLLSGRTLPIKLFPFSYIEFIKAKNVCFKNRSSIFNNRHKLKNLFSDFLKYGGFPEAILNIKPSNIYEVLSTYSKTVIYQDVIARLKIRKSHELENLFVYLISNISNPFSYKKIADLFGSSDKTIKEYIHAFEESFLLFEIDIFSYSLKKQIRNPKKIYSIDTGQINSIAFKFSENVGKLFKNLIFIELKRLGINLYYYLTKNNLEIDFLLKKENLFSITQVSYNIDDEKTKKREVKALKMALDELNLKKGFIVTLENEEIIKIDNKIIEVLPAYKFLLLSKEQKLSKLFS